MEISAPLDADEIIRLLDLVPHPEGGWFRETFRDQSEPRAHSTAIYYLLKAGERSHWHRVDAAEVWHWYAGGPLALSVSPDSQFAARAILGPDSRKATGRSSSSRPAIGRRPNPSAPSRSSAARSRPASIRGL